MRSHPVFGFIRPFQRSGRAFTLAELLIALTILGVIAIFTIPKILQSQSQDKFNSLTKETAGMITGAYDAYKRVNTADTSTKGSSLTPYMNYVSVDTTSTVDYSPNQGSATISCASPALCLRLHNGGVLYVWDTWFPVAANNALVWFTLDPDGVQTGKADSVDMALYFNDRITSNSGVSPGSQDRWGSIAGPSPANDPQWLRW